MSNKILNKSTEMMIDAFLAKAKSDMKHDYPGHNVLDDLIGPAQIITNDKMEGDQLAPTSPDYGMQPIDMKNEQGSAARMSDEKLKTRVNRAPTSPDYGEQPSDMDHLHKELFAPMDNGHNSPTSPDEGLQPEKTYEEKAGDRGRPSETHYVPDIDDELSTAEGYDNVQHLTASIEDAMDEHTPNPDVKKMKKGILISKSDYELLLRAKKMQEKEEMEKSLKVQETLIKSAVSSELNLIKSENADLKKMVQDLHGLVQNLGSRPQERKSVANVVALNKSFVNKEEIETPIQMKLTKSNMLDAAEALVKSGKFQDRDIIELDLNHRLSDPFKQQMLIQELKKK